MKLLGFSQLFICFIIVTQFFSYSFLVKNSIRHSEITSIAPLLQSDASIENCEAKRTWQTIALHEPSEVECDSFLIEDRCILCEKSLSSFNQLKKLKGTYYINGLGSCAVGPRLVHPFEAHGFMKSFRKC